MEEEIFILLFIPIALIGFIAPWWVPEIFDKKYSLKDRALNILAFTPLGIIITPFVIGMGKRSALFYCVNGLIVGGEIGCMIIYFM